MNNEHLSIAKKLYNAISELISNPTIHIALLKNFPQIKDISPDKIFLLESIKFMGYISNADGMISQREVNIMNYVTGFYLSLESARELINGEDFLDDMTEVPLTVKILCVVENILYENDAAPDGDSLMNTLIAYFKGLGGLIADADDDITPIEHKRITQYINVIKEYASEHTLSPFFEY